MSFIEKLVKTGSHKGKRFTAGFLALAVTATTILSGQVGIPVTYADGATWVNEAKNWPTYPEGGQDNAIVNKWKAGSVYALCITPGRHNMTGLSAIPISTTVANYRQAQGGHNILSDEVYRQLSLLTSYYYEKGYGNNNYHIACQILAWCLNGSISGYPNDWSQAIGCIDAAAEMLSSVANKPEIMRIGREAYNIINTYNQKTLPQGIVPGLKDCVITNGEALNSQWVQNNGRYEMRFDCTSLPQLKSLTWNTSNWAGVNYTWEGNTLVFWSTAAPNGYAYVEVPKGMYTDARITETLTLYPGQTDEYQSLVAKGDPAYLYVGNPTGASGGSGGGGGTPGGDRVIDWEYYQPIIKQRKESFRSDYTFDLEKYCAETGKTLEKSQFEIFEAFDDSQLGDGTDGTVGADFMDPTPSTWSDFKSRTKKYTDEDGYFKYHTDKYYDYDKTYCLGHPKPKLQTVPEPETDEEGNVTNQDEIDWAEAVALLTVQACT